MNIYLIVEQRRGNRTKKQLEKVGNVVVLDSGNKDFASYKELIEDLKNKIIGIAPGIIDWKVPTQTLDKIKNIKGICTLSSWAHYIDLEYCRKRDIVVTNTPGANSQAVAEYAIWMMFSLARKLPTQIRENFKSTFDEYHQQVEILGKTAGIVGLGHIGSRIAKMAKGLGMNVVYWSPNSRDKAYEYRNFDKVLQTADFIFNCVETYKGTKNLFNKDKLSLMKKSSYFISVLGGMGWGPENFDYLIEMVNKNKIAGIAVENEHEPNYTVPQIKKEVNVFIPGTYAYYTKEAEKRSLNKWVEAITGIINNDYLYKVE